MEENQVPNPEQFNVAGNGKKKKGMGPVKGLLVALLLVFLICVIGLLVRMVIAGDGDYFKPIKSIFGLEEEEESKSEKKAEVSSRRDSSGKTSFQSAGRYALLSDDVDGSKVKHYRLTIDMGEFFESMMEEMGSLSSEYDYDDDDYYYDDEDYSFDWDEYDSSSSDYLWDDEDYEWDYDDDDYYYDDEPITSGMDELESIMGFAMMVLSEMADMIDGEMYFDVYFEGNEIIQVVVGYDYGPFLENLYNYMKEEDEDSLEEEGISSVDDLADMVVEQFDEILDKDALYDMLMDSSDEDLEASLKEMGIKEKDIKEAIDFNNDRGVIEFYINGTTKLKAILSMVLESEDFQSELEAMEEETGVKVDEDNIIESILEAANETESYSEFGLEFVEVN